MDIGTLKGILWGQFGAAIDMLENGMTACPKDLWSGPVKRAEFWYFVYHTLFWLDFYLSGSTEGFAPPAPFTLSEIDPAGPLPERVYTKEELQAYLVHCRAKCRATIAALTEEATERRCRFSWGEVSFAELLLDNMRHVQHTAGQLNLLLRRTIDAAPRWVAQTGQALEEGPSDETRASTAG
jgi:hypothetical protein